MMTECAHCRIDPTTHSFSKLTMRGSAHVFYTNFLHVKDYSPPQSIIDHLSASLDPLAGQPWIWLLDCEHFTIRHASKAPYFMGLIRIFKERYCSTLTGIYVLHGSSLLQSTLTVIMPLLDNGIVSMIQYVRGSPLEMTRQLETMGWSLKEIKPILDRLLLNKV
jgi:hypothetical protein